MGLKWGLLGAARINAKLVAGARATDEADIVAVASRDRAKAAAQARELGIPRTHRSYDELLADPDIDAVYVALPNAMHVEWTIRVLEAGKHVLCEKPMTRRAAEAEAAFDAAERAGRLLSEGFMWRHHPQAQRARDLCKEGAVGRLRVIRAAFSFPLASPDDIRAAAELDGGALMDVGCYCVNAARYMGGDEPVRVWGEQLGEEVDMTFVGGLRFPSGLLALFDCGLASTKRDDLELVGDEGSIFLDDPWHGNAPVLELRHEDGTVERVECHAANPYGLELENFGRAARGEEELLLGREDALAQARTIEALYRAAAEGCAVAL